MLKQSAGLNRNHVFSCCRFTVEYILHLDSGQGLHFNSDESIYELDEKAPRTWHSVSERLANEVAV